MDTNAIAKAVGEAVTSALAAKTTATTVEPPTVEQLGAVIGEVVTEWSKLQAGQAEADPEAQADPKAEAEADPNTTPGDGGSVIEGLFRRATEASAASSEPASKVDPTNTADRQRALQALWK